MRCGGSLPSFMVRNVSVRELMTSGFTTWGVSISKYCLPADGWPKWSSFLPYVWTSAESESTRRS
eukprot:5118330-Lingulodinium_polyedra.AAC.1